MRATHLLMAVAELAELSIAASHLTRSPSCAFDVDAEAEVIAALWWGVAVAVPLEPDDYYATVHAGIAEVLASASSLGVRPTIELLMRGLEALGCRAPALEEQVRALLEPMPVAMLPDRAADRVRALAWRRRMVRRLDRLRALLVSRDTTDAEIETELDGLVDLGATQPERRVA